MKKLFSMLVCMIVCFAASQALAAYDFTGKSNATLLKDMKAWSVNEWDQNIRALLNTGDVALIKRSLAVAEKAINSTTAEGVTADLIVKILGDNDALIIEHIGAGYTLALATDAAAASAEGKDTDNRSNLKNDSIDKDETVDEDEDWTSGKSRK